MQSNKQQIPKGTSMHTSLTSPEEIKHWLKSYGLPFDVSEAIKIEAGKGYIFDRLYGTNSTTGHWNFVYTSKSGNEVIVYDPFGVPFYAKEFKNKKIIYSLEQDQKLNEKSCGLYCFLFAFKLFNHILKLKNYMIIDFKTSDYFISAPKNLKIENFNRYKKIYEEIHRETKA